MKNIKIAIAVCMLLVLSGCGKSNEIDYSKTNTIKFHNLVVELPQAFVNDEENSNNDIVFYSYDSEDKYDGCMVYFAISDYPKDDLKEAIQQEFYEKHDWSYSEKNINGNKWAIGYRKESEKFNQSFYVINKDGKEYSFSFDDFGSGERCSEALKHIENSLKFN